MTRRVGLGRFLLPTDDALSVDVIQGSAPDAQLAPAPVLSPPIYAAPVVDAPRLLPPIVFTPPAAVPVDAGPVVVVDAPGNAPPAPFSSAGQATTLLEDATAGPTSSPSRTAVIVVVGLLVLLFFLED